MFKILKLAIWVTSFFFIQLSLIGQNISNQFLTILGIAQDAGYPQIGCKKSCCKHLTQKRNSVTCIGVYDTFVNKYWLIEATPDIKDQIIMAEQYSNSEQVLPNGIFITHAHMGHYTGLMQLGREAFGASEMPVYVMSKMKTFLEENGPWSQLVDLKNISLHEMKNKDAILLSDSLRVIPLLVPHRDEFSETVGFLISGQTKLALFIPDIDKWSKWDESIIKWIKEVDYAFLDGTFYQNGEIWGRDMSEIPHPFIKESMELFKDLPKEEKAKIHFIHFNHTNPLLNDVNEEWREVIRAGFKIAEEGMKFELSN